MAEKKCVGIVTLDDYVNYGNRLQNYALTKLLQSEGYCVVNGIQVFTKTEWVYTTSNWVKKLIKLCMPFPIVRKKLNAYTTRKYKKGLMQERQRRFELFNDQYTAVLMPIIAQTHRQVNTILRQHGIDYYIAGSDQVWNPHFAGKQYQFLTFAPENRRLSFAASIGVECIPPEQERQYKKNLSEMKYLSVREQRAVEIIKDLTGRDADLTLDPTLLLEPEQWQQAVKKPNIALEAEYICTYFLGETPEAVKVFAQEKGLPVYALNSEEHPELFVLDPGEFLYMIQHAAYVLTDSFHAVAFSIKFHREFYVFDRKQEGVASMFSRIETITKRFGLENRIQSRERIVEQEPISQWAVIDKELLCDKEKSMKRLIDAMEMD